MPTLLDIAVINGSDAEVGLIEEATKKQPEITMGDARTIRGQSYKTLIRTGLPTVGFRNANEGTAVSKSTFENRRVETFILNPPWESDKAVADRDEQGPEHLIAIEAAGILEASFQTLAKQMYYGTSADAKGFPGLIAAYDAPNMTVDAEGTGAATSSVWAIKWGPQNCRWVWGEEGLLEVADPIIVRLTDDSGNPYLAYHQELLSYPGFQVASTHSAARIKNLSTATSHTLTDDMIYDLLDTFPAGVVPDMLLMSRRSRGQLRKSRTATNATGTPSPRPTDVEGVPIYVTEAILNTETAS